MKVKYPEGKILPVWPLLLIVLLAAGASAVAAEFDRGLLWKVEAGGAEPSYLFGTMHSDDPAVAQLPARVQSVFDSCRGVTLEVVLDPESLLAMTGGLMLGDGTTLESHIGAPLYRRVVTAMAAYGVPEMMVSAMKPWAVAMTLMTPPTETGDVLDLLLYRQAAADGKPVDGLETPLEQLSVFDAMPEQDQIALLRDTLDSLPQMQGLLDELKEAYLARDLRRLVEISDRSMDDSDPELAQRVNNRLIVQRNHRMAQRMQSRVRKGGQFIAVGALHLPGDEGVLSLLSRQGYRLTRVY